MIFEVKPDVYKKSAQIAHIYGVQPGSARRPPCRAPKEEQERDSFRNLILLCLAHHVEVDDKKKGANLHPPELLFEWKRKHEGEHDKNPVRIRNPMTDELAVTI
ncbi:HNH endonuclease [Streptosporangium roseum]|uniref:HNH endonuclease n=1 Tax=Streptosporangium roseum TaxID=2001 RepID=UPI003320B536